MRRFRRNGDRQKLVIMFHGRQFSGRGGLVFLGKWPLSCCQYAQGNCQGPWGVSLPCIEMFFQGARATCWQAASLAELRHTDVSGMPNHAKGRQQPDNDADHHDDVQDLFDLAVHRNIRIHEPEEHADDDQRDNERYQ